MYFLDYLEGERNHIAFKEGKLVVQRLKYSFVYNLWSWNISYLGDEVFSLIGFFGVVGFKLRGGEVFCSPSFFLAACIPPSMLGSFLQISFIYLSFFLYCLSNVCVCVCVCV